MSRLVLEELQTLDGATTVKVADLAAAVQMATVDGISVKKYGAVGDGVNDDTAAIQACIDAEQRVWFPAGVYRTTGELRVDGKICHLFGDGVGASVVYLDHATANGVVFDLAYVQGGGVRNMSIASKPLSGDPQSVGSSGEGLAIINCNDNFICENFEVIRFGTCCTVYGCYQPRFVNFRFCWFDYAGIHIKAYDGTAASGGNGSLWAIGKIANGGYAAGAANATGILIEQASGEFFRSIDIQACGLSVVVKPTAQSWCRYLWFNEVLADTAAGSGWVFDGTLAEVYQVFCDACWSSNHVYNGVVTQGSNLRELYWNGGTIRAAANNGWQHLGGTGIHIDGASIINNSNGNPGVYPGLYCAANVAGVYLNACKIGNVTEAVANQHQGNGVVFDGAASSVRITSCDMSNPYSGSLGIRLNGTLSDAILTNNLPTKTANLNNQHNSVLQLNSYNSVAANTTTYLTSGGVGTLSQGTHVVESGFLNKLVVAVSVAPGAGQSFTYTLVVDGVEISLGSITGASTYSAVFTPNVAVNDASTVALKVGTTSGAGAAAHRAALYFGA